VYRRVRDPGIKFPEGLKYIGSWIEPNFDRCFQLMECDDARLLQEWVLANKPRSRHDLRDRACGAEQGNAGSGRAVSGFEITLRSANRACERILTRGVPDLRGKPRHPTFLHPSRTSTPPRESA
jgi:hypothetical protein